MIKAYGPLASAALHKVLSNFAEKVHQFFFYALNVKHPLMRVAIIFGGI